MRLTSLHIKLHPRGLSSIYQNTSTFNKVYRKEVKKGMQKPQIQKCEKDLFQLCFHFAVYN